MIFPLIFLFLFTFSFKVQAYALMDFQTDYCTMYKEGPTNAPEIWKDCCLEHDMYYWAGGTTKDRNNADLRLKECVEDLGYPVEAKIIFAGVKLGHLSPIKSKYPWNNGWFAKHQYLSLTPSERQQVEIKIRKTSFPEDVVSLFLERF
jgi:hypothetical protein